MTGKLDAEERLLRRFPDLSSLRKALPDGAFKTRGSRDEAERIADKLRAGLTLEEPERIVLRSIVSPGLRPAIEVLQDVPVQVDHPLWLDINDAPAHNVLSAVCRATGRIEFSSGGVFINTGTGFLAGDRLVMTNRHVAEVFSVSFAGFGTFMRPGFEARINFCREAQRLDSDPSATFAIERVEMLHPWFDLALLRIVGMPDGVEPLELSTNAADASVDQRCCVVGYPSFNSEENEMIQKETVAAFDRKHVSPGVIDAVEDRRFGSRTVRAIGHDSSTLTGNSGAPLLRLDTGKIVGLHFHGNVDGLNWAVPASDIGSDMRIIDAGVAFDGTPQQVDGPWTIAWEAQ